MIRTIKNNNKKIRIISNIKIKCQMMKLKGMTKSNSIKDSRPKTSQLKE
jgi:hypothetical protein